MSTRGFSEVERETLLREGIRAARAGKRALARRLLRRALSEDPNESRAWLWLSATTDDPSEQREMLEKAVAADPYNAAAQKGLAHLIGKVGGGGVVPPDTGSRLSEPLTRGDPGPVAAGTNTFDCSNCGGRMAYYPETGTLVCEHCGHIHEVEEELAPDRAEAPIGEVLPTPKANAWASQVNDVECGKCGAHTAEPPGVKTQQCPYCGSRQLIESQQLEGMVDPQVIALFRIQEKEAFRSVRRWLGRGLFSPDDLVRQVRRMKLRPAYYPFWTFDGGVEIRWSVEVRENYGRGSHQYPEWRTVRGTTLEFFDDVLVSGVTALKKGEIAAVEPFNLKDVIRFEPDHLAGWPALAYDLPLADASIAARETVLKRLRPRVRSQIEPGREKRDIRIGAGNWSGVTFKHVLLPLWIGTYAYGGEEFHVLVNGQTGKAGGHKPRDNFKVAGIWVIGLLGGALLVAALAWLFMSMDLF